MGTRYRHSPELSTSGKWVGRLTVTLTALGVSFVACKVFREWQACGKVRYSWRPVAKTRPLHPKYAHSLTALKSNDGRYPKVFVMGGDGIVSESLDVHVLDQSLASWRVVGATCEDGRSSQATTHRRWSHTSSGVGRSIFVFGGHLVGTQVSNSSLLIHASNNARRSHSPMPARETAEILEFDGDSFVWSTPSLHGRPPCARCSHTSTVVGTRIFVFGGYGEGVPLNDVHILDTFLGTWITPKVIGTPPSPRCSHTACVVDHGKRIMIYGGYGVDHEKDIWFLEINTPFVRTQEELAGTEVVAWSKGIIGEVPQPVVLCGPSGVGKSSLIKKLIEDFPDRFGFSVSHTSRQPREQEVHGVHYYFTTREVMEADIEDGKFLESAEVHGNLYGTSIAAIEAVGNAQQRCLLDIDVQGARLVKHSSFRALFIFIAPPTYEDLEQRIRGRGTETEEEVRKRLRSARTELQEGQNLWLFDHVLVNDNFDQTYQQLKKLLDLDCACIQLCPELEQCELENPLCSYCTRHENRTPLQNYVVEHEGRSAHTAVAIGTRVFIYGGIRLGGRASNELLVLEVASLVGGAPGATRNLKWLRSEPEYNFSDLNLWSPTRLSARYNHQAVKISPDEILVTGGFNGKNPLADSFVIKISKERI